MTIRRLEESVSERPMFTELVERRAMQTFYRFDVSIDENADIHVTPTYRASGSS